MTDGCASIFNILGAFVDLRDIHVSPPPLLCEIQATARQSNPRPEFRVPHPFPSARDVGRSLDQAVGLLYFNLASIMWTSCFAFTLYRDHAPTNSFRRDHRRCPSSPIKKRRAATHHPALPLRRDTLRRYEISFHLLCWPVPAALAGTVAFLGFLGDSGAPSRPNLSRPRRLRPAPVATHRPSIPPPPAPGSWCALGPAYAHQYLLCFYLPLLCAFAYNFFTYALVPRSARDLAGMSPSASARVVSAGASAGLRRHTAHRAGVAALGRAARDAHDLAVSSRVRRRVATLAHRALPGEFPGRCAAGRCTIVQVKASRRRSSQVLLWGAEKAPSFALAALEALCMPLQGALNAAVYGWSLPSIRDMCVRASGASRAPL